MKSVHKVTTRIIGILLLVSTLLFESDFKHYFRYTDGAVLSNLDRINVEQIEPYKSTGMYTVHRTLMFDVSTG